MNSGPPFVLFGPAHLTVIALTFALPAFFWLTARGPGREKYRAAIRWTLAGLLVVNWFAYAAVDFQDNHDPTRVLPMQLCDWALITTVVALLQRPGKSRQRWFEISYFWGLAGTFQAILTPNLQFGFPGLRFISFFVAHCSIVIGVLFLAAVERLRPEPGAMLRTMIWSEVYLVAALAVNALTGQDFGFLSHRPAGHSLLDYLSNNHFLYVLEINLLAVLFFTILYLPYLFSHRARSRPPVQ